MAMQGQQRLFLLDESPDGDASDMHIERHVLVALTIQGGAIKRGIVRRGVHEKDSALQRVAIHQYCQVVLNGAPLHIAGICRHRSLAFFRRDAAGIHVSRNIVALPVFQQKRRGRNTCIAVEAKISERRLPAMQVLPEPWDGIHECRLHYSWIVISEDQKYGRVGLPQRVAQATKSWRQIILHEIRMVLAVPSVIRRSWQEIAAKKEQLGPIFGNLRKELFITLHASMKVGDEETRKFSGWMMHVKPSYCMV